MKDVLAPLSTMRYWEIRTKDSAERGREYVVAVLARRKGKVIRISGSDLGKTIVEAVAMARSQDRGNGI